MASLATPTARRLITAGTTCVLILLAGGCVVGSREPLYDRSRDTVLDAGLVGTWRGPGGDFTIRRGPGRSYRTDGEEGPTDFDLVRIGRRLYLFPRVPSSGLGTVLFQSCQVRRVRRQLHLRPLDVAVLADRLRRGGAPLAHEAIDLHTGVFLGTRPATRPATSTATTTAPDEVVVQNLVLTDHPRRIRQYVIDHEDDAELFAGELVLSRVRRRRRSGEETRSHND